MAESSETSSAAERVISTPSNLKSPVWKYFGFWSMKGKIVEPRDKVVCKLCKLQMAYHSTTSNMRAHLENMHPSQFSQMSGVTPSKQPRLDSYFTPPATSSLSAARQEACTTKLTSFICKDMRPISTVEGRGFREFCHELEPRFRIPSRGTITDRIVKIYDSALNNIKEIIKDKDVALTTDGWTSLATDAYVTVTAHWISDDWEIHNVVLKTKELRESHSAENVGECIQDILDVYGIKKESVIAITTDNATNYVNAVERHLEMVSVPCVAHTINLAVRKGLGVRAIENPVSRLKLAASHFNKSTTNSYLLEDKQKLLGLKMEKLINDCPTRWNSTYDMICRASEQQAAVAAVVIEKKLSQLELTTSEWTLMETVREVLKPFKVATEALSTDKYPTASAVLPLKHVLLSQLSKQTTGESSALREMKTKIIADLEKRYSEEKGAFMLLNRASYLDPRFHRLVHLTGEHNREVRATILEEMKKANTAGSETVSDPGDGQSRDQQGAGKTALTAMGDLFGDTYCQARPDQDSTELLKKEMSMYEEESPIHAQQNPLAWWKTSGSGRYPHIAQMAKKYLCIPGSSVRSERVFSSAGNIVNKKRSALASSQVDRLVFLANNM